MTTAEGEGAEGKANQMLTRLRLKTRLCLKIKQEGGLLEEGNHGKHKNSYAPVDLSHLTIVLGCFGGVGSKLSDFLDLWLFFELQ